MCDLQPAPPALADACYVPAQRVAAVPTIPPPRSRPSPRRPPLLFGDSARMSARIAPSPSPAAPAPAPEKTRPTTTAPDVASLDLDGMEAILAGFRELKELKEGARQALLPLAAQHDALSTVCREGSSGHECAPHPAIHKHSHFVTGWRVLAVCTQVEELQAEIADLDDRLRDRLPVVRAIHSRLSHISG